MDGIKRKLAKGRIETLFLNTLYFFNIPFVGKKTFKMLVIFLVHFFTIMNK